MRFRIAIIATVLTLQINAQIDQSILVVGRNVGTHTFHDGETTRIMGFTPNLSSDTKIPAPTLIVNSGDSVKIDFWNMSQGAPHTIHLHGLDVDQQNDGVPMTSFEVLHMEHGYYYFKAPHPGTYLYHCHVGSTIHLQAGMYGLIIVRPSNGDPLLNWDNGESYDREFSLLASEIDTVWHNDTILDHDHDMNMPLYVPATFQPQYFLVNGKSGSQLDTPDSYMYVFEGDKVYMRLANIGYFGVRYIFPDALNTRVVSSDGRILPSEVLSDTVEVLPGERYEAFVQIGSASEYPVIVEHFNLNTQVVAAQQNMYFKLTTLGMDEEQLLNVYPNPSNGIFYFDHYTEYTVSTIEGKLISSGSGNYMDLSGFPKGTYLLFAEGISRRVVLH